MTLRRFNVPIHIYFDVIARRRTWLLVPPDSSVGVGDVVAIYEFNSHSQKCSGNFICRTVLGLQTLGMEVPGSLNPGSIIINLGDTSPDYPF